MRVGDPYVPHNLAGKARSFAWLTSRPHSQLSQGAKLAYTRLAEFAGRDGACHPKIATLAEEMGVAQRQAAEYVAELEFYGIIRIKRTGRAAEYTFLAHSWMPDVEGVSEQADLCYRTYRKAHRRPVESRRSDMCNPAYQTCTPPQVTIERPNGTPNLNRRAGTESKVGEQARPPARPTTLPHPEPVWRSPEGPVTVRELFLEAGGVPVREMALPDILRHLEAQGDSLSRETALRAVRDAQQQALNRRTHVSGNIFERSLTHAMLQAEQERREAERKAASRKITVEPLPEYRPSPEEQAENARFRAEIDRLVALPAGHPDLQTIPKGMNSLVRHLRRKAQQAESRNAPPPPADVLDRIHAVSVPGPYGSPRRGRHDARPAFGGA